MAALALGIAGSQAATAIFGSTLFGMSAGGIGFFAGSFIGNFLTGGQHTNVQGPRLSDLKFQAATYGNAIPRAFGTDRLAGNVIWATDVVETITTTESGGGKGGGPSQTSTTYSYSVSFAVGLCAGPIIGVSRIWAAGKIIYDIRATATPEAAAASNSFAAGIRVYTGSTTQQPDSLIQADVGVANCPAFRNLAYIVFDTLQLAPFNAKNPPNIEVEVIVSGSTTQPVRLGSSGVAPILDANPACAVSYNDGVITASDMTFAATATVRQRLVDVSGTVLQNSTTIVDPSPFIGDVLTFRGNFHGVAADANANGKWRNVINRTNAALPAEMSWTMDGTVPGHLWKVNVGMVFVLWRDSSTPKNLRLCTTGINQANQVPESNFVRNVIVTTGNVVPQGFWDGTSFWVADNLHGNLYQYDGDVQLLATYTYPAATYAGPISIYGSQAFFGKNGATAGAIRSLNSDFTTTLVSSTAETSNGSNVLPYAYGVIIGNDDVISMLSMLTSSSTVTLASVVQTICTDAGLSVSDLDTSQLTQIVSGYVVPRNMTGRAAIEPLMPIYYFDAVETDNVIRFVTRGGSSVATIVDDELGAHVQGPSTNMPDPLIHTRIDEAELPRRTETIYLSAAASYAQGTQSYEHKTARSKNQVQLSIPAVLTDDVAAKVSEANTEAAWLQRDQYKFQTGTKYLYLDPTDIVTVTSNGITYSNLRLTSGDEFAQPGVCSFEAVADDASLYNPAALGASVPIPVQVVTLLGPTACSLLDVPLLRDQDDTLGFYMGMSGFLSGWPGAQLFASQDGGQIYSQVQNGLELPAGATMGVAVNALSAVASGRYETIYWNEVLTVQLNNGTLSSCTLAQLYNGSNVLAVGSEVIQFLNATLTGTKTYELTGLLRGRLGTGTSGKDALHVVNEAVVLLSASTVLKVRDGPTNLNVAQSYKPVTIGRSLQGTDALTFTNTGTIQKPLAPSQVGGGRNVAFDLIVNWNRNTRYTNVMQDYVDAPLGEASESYSIDIYNGSTVVRTITATTNTATYTVAQQVTDFGSAQSSITLKVYQVSAAIGRGYGTQATI